MANGSEQFLGQQLATQAQALQNLVDKMAENILELQNLKIKVGESIPKFAVASNNVKGEMQRVPRDYDSREIVMFMSGKCNLKIYPSAELGLQPNILADISFLEGDVLQVKRGSTYTGATNFNLYKNGVNTGILTTFTTEANVLIEKIEIMYDLVDKPNFA